MICSEIHQTRGLPVLNTTSHPSLVHAEANIAKQLLRCTILSIYLSFIMLNVFVSQQAAVCPIPGAANCKVTTQVCPLTIYLCFILLNMLISQQAAIGQLHMMDFCLTLDKVNLPAPDGVKQTITPDVMMCYLTPDGVNRTITPDVMKSYLTPDGVNSTIAPEKLTNPRWGELYNHT